MVISITSSQVTTETSQQVEELSPNFSTENEAVSRSHRHLPFCTA